MYQLLLLLVNGGVLAFQMIGSTSQQIWLFHSHVQLVSKTKTYNSLFHFCVLVLLTICLTAAAIIIFSILGMYKF